MLDITSGANLDRHKNSIWAEQWRVDLLKEHWGKKSASRIAAMLGPDVTRNSVIGKAGRLGLGGNRPPPLTKEQKLQRRRDAFAKWKTTVGWQPKVKAQPVIAAAVRDAEIPQDQRRTLAQLTSSCCHWPVGDPGKPGFFFCGSPDMRFGTLYCIAHYARSVAQKRRAA